MVAKNLDIEVFSSLENELFQHQKFSSNAQVYRKNLHFIYFSHPPFWIYSPKHFYPARAHLPKDVEIFFQIDILVVFNVHN